MVVLAGPTLQDASCDHTVIHINAGLDDSILYVAGPTWPGDCMLASIYSAADLKWAHFKSAAE